MSLNVIKLYVLGDGPLKERITTVITDLDNTLYDWVEIWYQSFNALLQELVAKSGISQSVLEVEIRHVFQKYGTSEYTFLIQALPSLRTMHPDEDLVEVYRSAIEAHERARLAAQTLYPTVLDTLQTLRSNGCLIVAYTESMAFYTMRRLRNMKLDGLIDFLYSSPDHDAPADVDIDKLRLNSPADFELQYTIHRHIPAGELKPNPQVLLDIIKSVGAVQTQTTYVGDSLMKDIAMAQAAGVTDVHAKYGEAQHREAYSLLRRVSHWNDADIERERRIHARGEVIPKYVLRKSYSELLDYFNFDSFSRHGVEGGLDHERDDQERRT